MQTVILCGGYGTRMKEETEFKPKPLVTVGDKPILWHIMKLYAHYGFNEFVLALGYKGWMIKEYFLNEKAFTHDFTLDTATGDITYHNNNGDDFKITFVETGLDSGTGTRVQKIQPYLTGSTFMLTYGDGLSDINIQKLAEFHKKHNKMGTITGVHPRSKYGRIKTGKDGVTITDFDEKPLEKEMTSGGFMVLEKECINNIGDSLEESLKPLAKKGGLSVYKHEGFWKAMDTYRESEEMNTLWNESRPWAVWEM
jgi:glucose-1-phosphate cytidylyltransferase